MRAISLPTAHPIAAAALALVAAVLAPLAAPSAALAERWLRPVPGEVARPFSYSRAAPFARGAHRGADLAAPPGTVVRAACHGRVVHAGAVAGPEQVVSVRCGDRRVSYLPLAAVEVREGATIRAGAPLGTVAAGHGGLHLGVRREGDAFGYEDPLPLLAPPASPSAPATRPSVRRSRPRLARPRAAPQPRTAPLPRAATRPAPLPRAEPPPSSPAPWPVWAGLAALLAGGTGSGTIAVRRRVARSRAAAAPSVQVG